MTPEGPRSENVARLVNGVSSGLISMTVAREFMREPGPSRPRFDNAAQRYAGSQHLPDSVIEQDARTFGPDRQLERSGTILGADVQAAAPDQRIAGDQREVEQQLHRALG